MPSGRSSGPWRHARLERRALLPRCSVGARAKRDTFEANGSIKGKAVHFDDRFLHVELEDGRMISTPMEWYADLAPAALRELKNLTFICHGTGIE
ncbi:DUF2442 domain-containing protein [uncultured Thiodictyon sp.]|uniref:DUF2442 domain-containing protein n=1 Tax=uncultured Thiodictyon sp. TaxID=1846217 RepID=UPI003421EFBE